MWKFNWLSFMCAINDHKLIVVIVKSANIQLHFIFYRKSFLHAYAQLGMLGTIFTMVPVVGVSKGPTQFKIARKIWPLLELLAQIGRVLACSCSQNFCYCSHARILVKIPVWQNFGEKCTRYECFSKHASSFCWHFFESDTNNSSRKASAKVGSNLRTWRDVKCYYN